MRKIPKKSTVKNDKNLEIKKPENVDGNSGEKKESKEDTKKKTIMSLKNNIQFFNKLTGNKKITDENKEKEKILLFPVTKFIRKDDETDEEQEIEFFVLNPESNFILYFDIIIFICILYSVFYTPLKLSMSNCF